MLLKLPSLMLMLMQCNVNSMFYSQLPSNKKLNLALLLERIKNKILPQLSFFSEDLMSMKRFEGEILQRLEMPNRLWPKVNPFHFNTNLTQFIFI